MDDNIMISITESAGGYLRAGLTGLGGVFTGGPVSAFYDNMKERAALQAAALKSSNPYDMYTADTTGKSILYSMGSSIPVVGSVANMMAYADRQNAERRAGLIGELGKARKREPWE